MSFDATYGQGKTFLHGYLEISVYEARDGRCDMEGYIPFRAQPFYAGPFRAGHFVSGHFVPVPFRASPNSCPTVPFRACPILCPGHFRPIPFRAHSTPISCPANIVYFKKDPIHAYPISC